MTKDEIEALAHRTCWRYRKSGDPHHSDTYTFNAATLHEFVRRVVAEEREACARAAEGFTEERDDRRWVPGSLYDTLRLETAAAIRKRSN